MHNHLLIMLATNTIFIDLLCITLSKLHVKFQPNPLQIFLSKVEKVQKTHKLRMIMLINPSLYNFLEKIIFDLQITIDRVHPVQILSRSDYCITTQVSTIGVWSLLYNKNQIFPGHAVFAWC